MPESDTQTHPVTPSTDASSVERLVTLETQREFDFLSGARAERTFLKMYVAARTSGLLAAISDRDWKTLCVLATYMDEGGYCYPSQAELARALGCSRQMANERVNSLARFRFHDRPVLLLQKDQRGQQGRWARNGYQVLPIASLSIFGGSTPPENAVATPHDVARVTVSSMLDTVHPPEATVSSATVTVQLDTNKNHTSNQNENLSKLRKAKPQTPAMGSQATTPTAAQSAAPTGFTPVSALLQDRATPHSGAAYDDDRQVLVDYLADFSREFGDRAPLKSSTTRVYNLYRRSGLPRAVFIEQLYRARAITKERSGSIRGGRFAYFVGVLEDVVGLKPAADAPA